MSDLQTTVTEIANLKASAKSRGGKRRHWKMLRRNLDPRDRPKVTNDTTPIHMFDVVGVGRHTSDLAHNDAGTFFTLGLHMLTHRGPRWRAALSDNEREDDEEVRRKGVAERIVQSVWMQNDERLVGAGKQQFDRQLMDPALETGTSIYYRDAYVQNGEVTFLIEPLDPNQAYYEFDRHGLSRIVYEDRRRIKDLIAEGGINPKFNLKELNEKEDKDEFARVADYWERTFERVKGDMVPVLRHAIVIDEEIEYLKWGIEGDTVEIPYKVHRYNGEAVPGHVTNRHSDNTGLALIEDETMIDNVLGRSILAENEQVYIRKHDFLTSLWKHLQQVLNADTWDVTRGGQPKIDPKKFLDTDQSTHTTYDANERGPEMVRLNPVDSSAQFIWSDIEAGRQRGSVPDLLHGNLQIQLSGFAISQILESSEASVGTFNVVYKQLLGDLGQWIVDTFKRLATENQIGTQRFVGPVPSTARREMMFEDVDPSSDLPTTTVMFAENELAKPSDLTERIAQARQLDPGGGAIVRRTTIYDKILWDIVQDPNQEAAALIGQQLENLPEIQKIEFISEMEVRARALDEMGDTDGAAAVRQMMDDIRSTLTQGANNQNINDSSVSSGTRQDVLPTEVRTGGVGTGPVRSTTPNQQQV